MTHAPALLVQCTCALLVQCTFALLLQCTCCTAGAVYLLHCWCSECTCCTVGAVSVPVTLLVQRVYLLHCWCSECTCCTVGAVYLCTAGAVYLCTAGAVYLCTVGAVYLLLHWSAGELLLFCWSDWYRYEMNTIYSGTCLTLTSSLVVYSLYILIPLPPFLHLAPTKEVRIPWIPNPPPSHPPNPSRAFPPQ